MLSNNIDRTPEGVLTFAGYDVTQLAKEYGTPLYLMDEARIRANCRMYLQAFRDHFGLGSLPLYASKAASFKQMYRIMAEEGMGVDVVSSGNCTPLSAPASRRSGSTSTATARPMRILPMASVRASAFLWRTTGRSF